MAFEVLFLQPASGDPDIGIPGAALRKLTAALAGTGQDGVFHPTTSIVAHRGAGADFSVDIGPFTAIVAGDDVANQGSYLITNTATYNLTVCSAAPGSGTRTHRVIAQIRDKRSNGTYTTYDWLPLSLQDTGGGMQSLPASALDLASVTVAAGQANIQDSHITQRYGRLQNLKTAAGLSDIPDPQVDVGPWQSWQTGLGSWNSTDQWVEYSQANWPALTFTAPPSGAVWVTIGGALNVVAGNIMVGWRMTGGKVVNADGSRAFGASGAGMNRGGRRTLVTAITPGASCTVKAYWYQGQAGNSDAVEGQIYVEAVQ